MLIRLFRVALGVLIGLFVFVISQEFTRDVSRAITHGRPISHFGWQHVQFALGWRGPGLILTSVGPLVVACLLMEWRGYRSLWSSVLVWLVTFTFVAWLHYGPLEGWLHGGWVSAAILAGLAHWIVAGSRWPHLSRKVVSGQAGLEGGMTHRWVHLMIACATIALLACWYMLPRFPYGPYTLYTELTVEKRAARPSFVALANEQTHPFMYGQRPLKRDWLAAIPRWPDVRDCLVRSERKKSEPDLRLINWDAFWTTADAEICLWRIFSSLGTPERAARWFEFHGLGDGSVGSGKMHISPRWHKMYPERLRRMKRRTKIVTRMAGGSRSLKEQRAMFPTFGPSSILVNILPHSENFSSTWTTENELLKVRVGRNTL